MIQVSKIYETCSGLRSFKFLIARDMICLAWKESGGAIPVYMCSGVKINFLTARDYEVIPSLTPPIATSGSHAEISNAKFYTKDFENIYYPEGRKVGPAEKC